MNANTAWQPLFDHTATDADLEALITVQSIQATSFLAAEIAADPDISASETERIMARATPMIRARVRATFEGVIQRLRAEANQS